MIDVTDGNVGRGADGPNRLALDLLCIVTARELTRGSGDGRMAMLREGREVAVRDADSIQRVVVVDGTRAVNSSIILPPRLAIMMILPGLTTLATRSPIGLGVQPHELRAQLDDLRVWLHERFILRAVHVL